MPGLKGEREKNERKKNACIKHDKCKTKSEVVFVGFHNNCRVFVFMFPSLFLPIFIFFLFSPSLSLYSEQTIVVHDEFVCVWDCHWELASCMQTLWRLLPFFFSPPLPSFTSLFSFLLPPSPSLFICRTVALFLHPKDSLIYPSPGVLFVKVPLFKLQSMLDFLNWTIVQNREREREKERGKESAKKRVSDGEKERKKESESERQEKPSKRDA